MTMCVVSMIMEHYGDKWSEKLPPPPQPFVWTQPAITPEEIEEFRKLLDRAREYDKRNNEPDCELEEKRERLRGIARELGVEIEFV